MAAQNRRSLSYAIIGGGMSGILAAIRLKDVGQNDFTVYEKGDKVGGTWRENRYPGLTCDVPAHCYTYTFAPNPDWSAFYAPGPEIQRYFEKVVDEHDIRERIRFNAEILSCIYRDGAWDIEASDGSRDRVDVVIAATGVLHHPNIPDIPGIKKFEGAAFHSARWNDSAPLDGKRIGVIGNGSTGVQIVSALSTRASRLIHFQRSPQWIMPVEVFDYTDEQRAAFRSDLALIDAIRNGEEYWGGIARFNKAIIETESDAFHDIEQLVAKNLEDNVHDPVLREKLRPNYKAACKRLIYSPGYYAAVQRPNVSVETSPIETVTANGIVLKDGNAHDLDVIVLATGFKADRFVRPITVKGNNGANLDERWEVRPTAYYAISIPDFPNFFLLNGPTAPVGNFSLIDIAEKQWAYIEQLLVPLQRGDARQVYAKREALADYEQRRIAAAKTTVFGSGCTSWYLDATGIPQTWPWSYQHFADAMKEPNLGDFEIA